MSRLWYKGLWGGVSCRRFCSVLLAPPCVWPAVVQAAASLCGSFFAAGSCHGGWKLLLGVTPARRFLRQCYCESRGAATKEQLWLFPRLSAASAGSQPCELRGSWCCPSALCGAAGDGACTPAVPGASADLALPGCDSAMTAATSRAHCPASLLLRALPEPRARGGLTAGVTERAGHRAGRCGGRQGRLRSLVL